MRTQGLRVRDTRRCRSFGRKPIVRGPEASHRVGMAPAREHPFIRPSPSPSSRSPATSSTGGSVGGTLHAAAGGAHNDSFLRHRDRRCLAGGCVGLAGTEFLARGRMASANVVTGTRRKSSGVRAYRDGAHGHHRLSSSFCCCTWAGGALDGPQVCTQRGRDACWPWRSGVWPYLLVCVWLLHIKVAEIGMCW